MQKKANKTTKRSSTFTLSNSYLKSSDVSDRRRSLLYYRDLLYELVRRDLKLRYKGSVIGIAWSLLNPLAQLLVFKLVFSIIISREIDNFLTYLTLGILGWNWFNNSITTATKSIVINRNLIRRPGFPAPILPLIAVTSHLINFLIGLPILIVVVIIDNLSLSSLALLFPVIVLIQYMLSIGLGLILAAVNVTFRDLEYLLNVLFRLLFLISGVFFRGKDLSLQYPILNLNPVLHLLDGYRAVVMSPEEFELLPLSIIFVSSLILLIVGYYVFQRASYRFVEEV